MRRALAALVPIAVAIGVACASDPKAPPVEPPPAGPGYDDLRVLSHDDCTMLRDHQIAIAVETALAPDGGTELLEAGAKMSLEAALRTKAKETTDAWIGRCTGKMIPANDLRCWRQSTTPEAFNACGDLGDAPAGSASSEAGTIDAASGG
jgi:hypothetical protein